MAWATPALTTHNVELITKCADKGFEIVIKKL